MDVDVTMPDTHTTRIYGGQIHCPRCGDRKAHDVEDTGDRARWLCRDCGHASYTVERASVSGTENDR